MTKSKRFGTIEKFFAALVSLLIILPFAMAQDSREEEAIARLLESLSNHSVTPESALDPTLSGEHRKTQLDLLSDHSYELAIRPSGQPVWLGDSTLSIPAKIQFKDETTTLDISSKVELVRRNGQWYFANYDFLRVPWLFWLFAVAMLAYGVLTAVTVIILRRRLIQSGHLRGGNYIKIFIPFFWPSLFRLTRVASPAESTH